jgi:hypothetical protein
LNVTVLVAEALRAAVDGRVRLDLGVPPHSGVADVLETLLKLYPKLARHLASDRLGAAVTLTVWPSSSSTAGGAVGGETMGQSSVLTVYLGATGGPSAGERDVLS